MNETLLNIKEICENILPILGAVALIIVIVLLVKLISTLNNANVALKNTNGTIDQVNDSIKKVQAPLDAVVKVSNTVDKAHDATLKGIEDAKEYVSKNAKALKEKVDEIMNKEDSSIDDTREPSPEDIIGGK